MNGKLSYSDWVMTNLHTAIHDMAVWEVQEHYKRYLHN